MKFRCTISPENGQGRNHNFEVEAGNLAEANRLAGKYAEDNHESLGFSKEYQVGVLGEVKESSSGKTPVPKNKRLKRVA